MPHPNGAFDFEKEVLPRLVAAYEVDRLTPFLGVGMSRPSCADWESLIGALEVALIERTTLTKDTKPQELIQRANRAVQTLRARGKGEFESALQKALFPETDTPPAQMTALANIWWPLVLTTNYDDLYVKAFAGKFDAGAIAAVGRSSEDCQRVLTSLSTAGRTLLWALQGHLSSRCEEDGFQREAARARTGHRPRGVPPCHASRAALPSRVRGSVPPSLAAVPRIRSTRELPPRIVRRSVGTLRPRVAHALRDHAGG